MVIFCEEEEFDSLPFDIISQATLVIVKYGNRYRVEKDGELGKAGTFNELDITLLVERHLDIFFERN